MFAALIVAYSIWTDYFERWVDVPQISEMHLKKLPLPWASGIAFAALFFIVLEGGYRLAASEKEKIKELQSNPPGPELVLECWSDAVNCTLLIRNTNHATAFNVTIHGTSNGDLSSAPCDVSILHRGGAA